MDTPHRGVAEAAAAHRLGQQIAVYRGLAVTTGGAVEPERWWQVALVLGVASLPIVILGVGVLVSWWLALLLVLAAAGAVVVWFRSIEHGTAPSSVLVGPVCLFEGGVVCGGEDGTPVEAFAWDTITAIYQAGTRVMAGSRPVATSYSYGLNAQDGRQVRLSGGDNTRIAELGTALVSQVTARELPKAQAAIDTGGTVAFGELTLNPNGIGGPRGYTTWAQLKDVSVRHGYLSIARRGRPAWKMPISRIPNLDVLLTLARQHCS